MTRYARPLLAVLFVALLATPWLIRRFGPRAPETAPAADVRARKTGTSAPNVVDLNRTVRPRRAHIVDDDH